jgi:hypothetical protein
MQMRSALRELREEGRRRIRLDCQGSDVAAKNPRLAAATSWRGMIAKGKAKVSGF